MAKKKKVNFDEVILDFQEYVISTKATDSKLKTISTGSLSLDISTGIGGIPLRKFTEIYGLEATGKTTLALSIAKNFINAGYAVLYVDIEQAVDLDRARHIIGDAIDDTTKFVLLQPHIMEEALTICELAIESGQFGLILVDSIAAMLPKKVQDDDLTDANVALLTRQFGIFLSRNAYKIRKYDVAFVGINQVRDKIGSYFGGFNTPGGHEWKHLCSLRIELRPGVKIEVGEDIVGVMSKFVVVKNKLAPPFRSQTFPIVFTEGIDYEYDVLEFASYLGVIGKIGSSSYYQFNDVNIGKGRLNAIEYLKNNKDTLDNIVESCYKSSKIVEEDRETDLDIDDEHESNGEEVDN